MPLFNPFAINPGAARTAQLVVLGDEPITEAQLSNVRNAYGRFKLTTANSVAGRNSDSRVLPDGTTVYIVSNSGIDQVFVRPAEEAPSGELHGVWILVQLYDETSTILDSSAPSKIDRHDTGRYRSLLYRVPRSMKAAAATLVYSGETLLDTTTLRTVAPADVNGPSSVYVSSLTGTLVESEGAVGFASGFVPYKGKATLVALRSSQTVAASSRYDGSSSTTRIGKVWDGDATTKTYTANYDTVGAGPAATPHVVSSTRTGEIIACTPRSVANGQVNYKVRELAGTYDDGSEDPVRFEKFIAATGASTDTDGIELADQSVSPPLAFTRRQIGYMDQSRQVFLTKSAPFQVRTRGNAVKRSLPVVGSYQWPVFYNDGLVFRLPNNDRANRKVSLVTYTGRKVLSLDLRTLPDLATDPVFADLDARISAGGGGVGSNTYIDEIGYGDFKPGFLSLAGDYYTGPEAPRRFAWDVSTAVFNSTYGDLDRTNGAIHVTLIPDQDIYKWADE
jgi:hypothetical protein